MRGDQRLAVSADPEESVLERVDGAQLDLVNGGICTATYGQSDVQALVSLVCMHA